MAKIVRVWPAGYSSDDPVDYARNAVFAVHPDGDLTLSRRGETVAVWSRGEWSRVEIVDAAPTATS